MTLHGIWMMLRVTFGLLPIIIGLDKFFNVLAFWEGYLSPQLSGIVPIELVSFMMISGVLEIIVGLLILTKWTKLGAYLAAGWLVLISINLILAGIYDVAARDLVMAVGALALAQLTDLVKAPTAS